MPGETDLGALLARLDPVLQPETLVWCTVPPGERVPDVAAFARIEEDEGTTLIVPLGVAQEHGMAHEMPSRRIEMRIHSALEAVGMTAAMSTALAAEGISANVVAAFHHDHVLVPADDAEAACATLREMTAPATLRPATADDTDALWLFVGWAGEELGPRATVWSGSGPSRSSGATSTASAAARATAGWWRSALPAARSGRRGTDRWSATSSRTTPSSTPRPPSSPSPAVPPSAAAGSATS